MSEQRIAPKVTPLSRPYFDACNEGRLLIQQCNACLRWQFYPRQVCSHCGGGDLIWRQATGTGCVASFTVVRRAISKAYEAPYVIVLVDLDEGVRMMSQLRNVNVESVFIGQRVEVAFEKWVEDTSLPVFLPLKESQTESIL